MFSLTVPHLILIIIQWGKQGRILYSHFICFWSVEWFVLGKWHWILSPWRVLNLTNHSAQYLTYSVCRGDKSFHLIQQPYPIDSCVCNYVWRGFWERTWTSLEEVLWLNGAPWWQLREESHSTVLSISIPIVNVQKRSMWSYLFSSIEESCLSLCFGDKIFLNLSSFHNIIFGGCKVFSTLITLL